MEISYEIFKNSMLNITVDSAWAHIAALTETKLICLAAGYTLRGFIPNTKNLLCIVGKDMGYKTVGEISSAYILTKIY